MHPTGNQKFRDLIELFLFWALFYKY